MNQSGGLGAVVREAEPRDAGRGIVRLPRELMRELGVLSGETVRLEGSGTTVARVWPGRGDLATDELRADGEIRTNAGASVGETVRVSAVQIEDAVRAKLVPTVDPGREADAVRETLERSLENRPVHAGERVKVDSLGEVGEFQVVETSPNGTVRITDATEIVVGTAEAGPASEPVTGVGITYENVGGLDEELEAVRELVELPLSDPGLFRRLGIEPPKGVLMYGPPGTGKTLIARAVANEANAHFVHVSGPEIVGKYKGESEERLRAIFEEAAEQAPSIVFFDELDAIAAQRENGGEMESRVVAQLLSLLDGLEARGEVVVIGATNRVDAIDPALRRPGRFDREVEIGVPDRTGRREILDIHTRGTPLADDVDLPTIAERTHGFVGADLRALVAEAAMHALRRQRDADDELTVTQADFDRARSAVEPSAMREFVAELPDTSFADVGGLEDAKATLEEAVEWPLVHRDLFAASATDPPAGILLYGPPGTGKTMLARAVASESDVNFIRVAGPELFDRYVGESERAIREVFERARQAAPTVVFFDELDAIAATRGGETHEVTERVVSQLLAELDSAADDPNLVVLAATNRKEAIDPALLRPGRLELHVHVPEPDEAARREILSVKTRDKPLAEGVDLDEMAAELAGHTGADIEALVRQASMAAIREAVQTREADPDADASVTITREHFRAARGSLEPTAPSLDGD